MDDVDQLAEKLIAYMKIILQEPDSELSDCYDSEDLVAIRKSFGIK